MRPRSTRQMVLITGLLLVTRLPVVAQEAAPDQPGNEPVSLGTYSGPNGVFTQTKAGTYYWDRPSFVRFAIIVACGGGSGGNGYQHGGPAAIWPGFGAPITTTVVGPLTESRYQIVIGSGGAGGFATLASGNWTYSGPTAGASTVWDAQSENLIFPGAQSDPPLTPTATQQSPFDAKAVPTWALTMMFAGRHNNAGTPPPNGTASAGGFPSIGDGGAGGDRTADGGTGGSCAGGGASGTQLQTNPTPPTIVAPVGGRGGDGFLRIIPLVDLGVVEQRVNDLLKSLVDAGSKKPTP
jgi:hypothetical protein